MQKQDLRNHLLKNHSEDELKQWFDPLSLNFSEEEKQVRVRFPHVFFAQWFATGSQSRFEEELGEFLGDGYRILYSNGQAEAGLAPVQGQERLVKSIDFPFGRQFTFDNFLVNKKNYFPLASAREVSKQRDIVFNPFVICGEGGTGKTHLIKAVANEISKRHDRQNIYCAPLDEMADIYDSRYKRDPFKAREHFLGCDFLIVDDFQRIRNHPGLQQEIIVLFNHFYDARKQMIFACSGKLSQYEFLDPTLKSRLEWGLIVTLKKPDLDIRISFVQEQCRLKKINLGKEQILLLAQRFQDFRQIQGILTKLFAFKELLKQDIGAKDFERILSNTEDKPGNTLSPEMVISITSRRFSVEPSEITGSKRHQAIAQARQVSMFLCRRLLGMSYPQLGRAFGGKDHSTVLYSVKKIEELQKDDKSLKKLLSELKEACLSARDGG